MIGLLAALGCAPEPAWLEPSPSDTRSCGPAPAAGRVDARVDLRLVVGRGVAVEDAAALTQGLARTYDAFGLRFDLVGPARWIVDAPVLAGDRDGFALLSDREAEREVYAPLRSLVADVATPARDEVVLVILTDLLAPESAAAQTLTEVRGLGFTPGPDAAPIVGLESFSPIAMVAWSRIGKYPEGGRAAMVAHEVGHALGLTHDSDPNNMMSVRAFRCTPALRAEQVARLRERVGGDG